MNMRLTDYKSEYQDVLEDLGVDPFFVLGTPYEEGEYIREHQAREEPGLALGYIEEYGANIAICRTPAHLTLAAYVEVRPDHPLHGVKKYRAGAAEVHGGCSYFGPDVYLGSAPVGPIFDQLNRPRPTWWRGFDGAGDRDQWPRHKTDRVKWYDGEYRGFEFMAREAVSMARQLDETKDATSCEWCGGLEVDPEDDPLVRVIEGGATSGPIHKRCVQYREG